MKFSELLLGILRIPLDALAVAAALLLAYRLRLLTIDLIPGYNLLEPATTLPTLPVYISHFVLPSIGGYAVIASLLSLYSLRSSASIWRELGRLFLASALWLGGVMVWFFLVQRQLFYSRILLVHGLVFLTVFTIAVRACVTLLQRSLLRFGVGVRSVVSFGQRHLPHPVLTILGRDARYRLLGHTENLVELRHLERRRTIDLVLQTDPNPKSDDTVELIDYCRSHHLGYAFLPPVLADVPHLLTVDRFGMTPVIRLCPTPLDGWGKVSKRIFDFLVSIFLLILLSPLFLLVSLLILLTMGWPILYVSKRVGIGGKRSIPVLKFRTMIRNADAKKAELLCRNVRRDGPLFKVPRDPRVTPLGRFLRRFDVDELPQLLNVFLGHLSLIGPRPHLPDEVAQYSSFQQRVFTVRPGITGLAQVSGRSSLSFNEEVALDLKYIEEWSPLLEVAILVKTVFAVLRGRGEV